MWWLLGCNESTFQIRDTEEGGREGVWGFDLALPEKL